MADTDEKNEQEKPSETVDDAAEDNVADAADEEDLEKLHAEIAKMEEEAAKIAAETDNLEKEKKAGEGAAASGGGDAAAGGSASGGGKDGAEKASVDQ